MNIPITDYSAQITPFSNGHNELTDCTKSNTLYKTNMTYIMSSCNKTTHLILAKRLRTNAMLQDYS